MKPRLPTYRMRPYNTGTKTLFALEVYEGGYRLVATYYNEDEAIEAVEMHNREWDWSQNV